MYRVYKLSVFAFTLIFQTTKKVEFRKYVLCILVYCVPLLHLLCATESFFYIFLFFQSFEMHILVKTYRSDISSDDACFVDISLFVFLDNHCQIIINASKFFVFKQISNAFLILY